MRDACAGASRYLVPSHSWFDTTMAGRVDHGASDQHVLVRLPFGVPQAHHNWLNRRAAEHGLTRQAYVDVKLYPEAPLSLTPKEVEQIRGEFPPAVRGGKKKIALRATRAQMAALTARAAQEGLTRQAYLERRIFGEVLPDQRFKAAQSQEALPMTG